MLQPTAHKGPWLLAHIMFAASTMQLNISASTASAALSHIGNHRAKSTEGCNNDRKHSFSHAQQGGLMDYSNNQKASEPALSSRSSCVSK